MLAACALCGCASGAATIEPIGRVPIAVTLEKLWTAHGGLDAARALRRVRARVSVEGDPPHMRLPAQTMEFQPDDWNLLAIGGDEYRHVLDLSDRPPTARAEQTLDYHLRSARMLCLLPLAIADPQWELWQDVTADEPDRPGVWAVPLGIPSPHAAYYLVPDPATGLLERVYYRVSHPRFAGKVVVAEFRKYRRVGGILLATEIAHSLVEPEETDPRRVRPADPFEPVESVFDPTRAGGDASDPFAFPVYWVLRFEDVVFE